MNTKKRIALVINDAWYAYNLRLSLAKEISKLGHEVVFIVPSDGNYSEKIRKDFKTYDIYIDSKSINLKRELKTISSFYKVYKKVKPDIVLQFTVKPNVYGSIIARLLRISCINNIAGLGTLFVKESLTTKIVKKLYKFSQKKVDKIFFQNNDDFQMFSSQGIVSNSKCDVLPGSGIDLEKFKPLEKKNNDKTVFLIVSRMLWTKGIGEFVDAARSIKKEFTGVEFRLLGFLDVNSPDSITRNQMDEWVNEGVVSYLGVSDYVQGHIADADCIVLPSYYREGVPHCLLEAASMAKPIITTLNIGCKEVVDHGINGFLCEPKSVDSLCQCMREFTNLSDVDRERMGSQGREKMKREFNETIIFNKYKSQIENILS